MGFVVIKLVTATVRVLSDVPLAIIPKLEARIFRLTLALSP